MLRQFPIAVGLYPGQADWGYRFIQLLERLGPAWDVRTPETMGARKILRAAEGGR
jgi:stearoyl-CoA desaturase (delta-9 desaturase)